MIRMKRRERMKEQTHPSTKKIINILPLTAKPFTPTKCRLCSQGDPIDLATGADPAGGRGYENRTFTTSSGKIQSGCIQRSYSAANLKNVCAFCVVWNSKSAISVPLISASFAAVCTIRAGSLGRWFRIGAGDINGQSVSSIIL